MQRGGRQCYELLGFAPQESKEAGEEGRGQGLTRAVVDGGGGKQHRGWREGKPLSALLDPPSSASVSAFKTPAAATSVMAVMLQDGAAMGSSPEKLRPGNRRARAAMLGF